MSEGLFRLLPLNFPSELGAAAFRIGEEVAWPPTLAVAAVEWFTRNGYAVLGTELWLLPDGEILKRTARTQRNHGNTVNRGTEESWSSSSAGAEKTPRDSGNVQTLQYFRARSVTFNPVWQRSRVPESCGPALGNLIGRTEEHVHFGWAHRPRRERRRHCRLPRCGRILRGRQ
jgi:hypothetical protein